MEVLELFSAKQVEVAKELIGKLIIKLPDLKMPSAMKNDEGGDITLSISWADNIVSVGVEIFEDGSIEWWHYRIDTSCYYSSESPTTIDIAINGIFEELYSMAPRSSD